MIVFVLRRLASALPTLGAILVLSFVLVRLTPGSPFQSERAVAPEVRAALAARYGLDRPLPVQLWHYLSGLAGGDLGPSIKYPEHGVAELLAESLPHTLRLGVFAWCWGIAWGLGLGVVAALGRGRWPDAAVQAVLACLGSTPSFVLAPLLVWLFAVRLEWAPPAGWGEARHLVLPAITLGSLLATGVARLTRAGIVHALAADYVRAARAKGMGERAVVLHHVLRPALVPLVSYIGPATAGLLVGSVAVERIFCIPGIGPYFVDAAQNRDYFLVMGIVLVQAVLLLACNLVADVACALLDPRLRDRGN